MDQNSKNILFDQIFQRDEILSIAKEIKKLLGPKVLVLFSGEVGSGKTTLIGEICQLLGFTQVASPSFAIHHRYENKKGQSLDHVDLYRLNDESDLDSTGFWDLFQQEQGWVMVEWSDRIADHAWPMNWPTFQVYLEKLEGDHRRVRIKK